MFGKDLRRLVHSTSVKGKITCFPAFVNVYGILGMFPDRAIAQSRKQTLICNF